MSEDDKGDTHPPHVVAEIDQIEAEIGENQRELGRHERRMRILYPVTAVLLILAAGFSVVAYAYGAGASFLILGAIEVIILPWYLWKYRPSRR